MLQGSMQNSQAADPREKVSVRAVVMSAIVSIWTFCRDAGPTLDV